MRVVSLSEELETSGAANGANQLLACLPLNAISRGAANAELVLKRCRTFSEKAIDDGRVTEVTPLFKFMHKANRNNNWLMEASTTILPYLHSMLQGVLRASDPHTVLPSSPSAYFVLSENVRSDKDTLNLLSAIMDICIDLCDVPGDNIEGHLQPLVTAAAAIVFGCKTDGIQDTVNSLCYAMDELARHSCFLLCHTLLDFPGLVELGIQLFGNRISFMFDLLERAPELSLKRSLILILRVLYERDEESGAKRKVKAKIRKHLTSDRFGGKRTLDLFKSLELELDDVGKRADQVLATMFEDSAIENTCMQMTDCTVQMKGVINGTKQGGRSQKASVDWNKNSIVIHTKNSAPVYFPVHEVIHMHWFPSYKAVRFTLKSNPDVKLGSTVLTIELAPSINRATIGRSLERQVGDTLSSVQDGVEYRMPGRRGKCSSVSQIPLSRGTAEIEKRGNSEMSNQTDSSCQQDGGCQSKEEERNVKDLDCNRREEADTPVESRDEGSNLMQNGDQTDLPHQDSSASCEGSSGHNSEPVRRSHRKSTKKDKKEEESNSTDVTSFPCDTDRMTEEGIRCLSRERKGNAFGTESTRRPRNIFNEGIFQDGIIKLGVTSLSPGRKELVSDVEPKRKAKQDHESSATCTETSIQSQENEIRTTSESESDEAEKMDVEKADSPCGSTDNLENAGENVADGDEMVDEEEHIQTDLENINCKQTKTTRPCTEKERRLKSDSGHLGTGSEALGSGFEREDEELREKLLVQVRGIMKMREMRSQKLLAAVRGRIEKVRTARAAEDKKHLKEFAGMIQKLRTAQIERINHYKAVRAREIQKALEGVQAIMKKLHACQRVIKAKRIAFDREIHQAKEEMQGVKEKLENDLGSVAKKCQQQVVRKIDDSLFQNLAKLLSD